MRVVSGVVPLAGIMRTGVIDTLHSKSTPLAFLAATRGIATSGSRAAVCLTSCATTTTLMRGACGNAYKEGRYMHEAFALSRYYCKKSFPRLLRPFHTAELNGGTTRGSAAKQVTPMGFTG